MDTSGEPAAIGPQKAPEALSTLHEPVSEGAIGAAVQSMFPPGSPVRKIFGTPSLTQEGRKANPGSEGELYPAQVTVREPGIGRGVAEFAGSLTTPDNLLLMLGMPQGVVGKLASLGFSSQMLVGAAQQVPQFKEALKRGDKGTAREICDKNTSRHVDGRALAEARHVREGSGQRYARTIDGRAPSRSHAAHGE